MEDCEELFLLSCGAASLLILEEQEAKSNHKKRQRVRKRVQRRKDEEYSEKLLMELRCETPDLYRSFLRMNSIDFDYLLSLVAPHIAKKVTRFRKPISPSDRLAVTIRYLETGESFRSLQYVFRIPHNTISGIIPAVCDAIYKILQPNYLKLPLTEEEWITVSEEFLQLWKFPNCIGALDGKHVVMTAPPQPGSVYFNYKGTHSIVVMAIADAWYKFLYIDVGLNGCMSDSVFNKSSFNEALTSKKLNLPVPKPLPHRNVPVPHSFVADDAFDLKPNILYPYRAESLNTIQRIFNYRLSRAKQVVENAFGVMSARFRVMRSPIKLEPLKTRKVTLACCVLHNYLMSRKSSLYFTTNLVDHYTTEGVLVTGEWRSNDNAQNLVNLQKHECNMSTETSEIRNEYAQYFLEEGKVPF